MNKKTYIAASGWIFTFIFGIHLLRIIFGWQVTIGDWSAPIWISYVALAIVGFMAYSATKLAK